MSDFNDEKNNVFPTQSKSEVIKINKNLVVAFIQEKLYSPLKCIWIKSKTKIWGGIQKNCKTNGWECSWKVTWRYNETPCVRLLFSSNLCSYYTSRAASKDTHLWPEERCRASHLNVRSVSAASHRDGWRIVTDLFRLNVIRYETLKRMQVFVGHRWRSRRV